MDTWCDPWRGKFSWIRFPNGSVAAVPHPVDGPGRQACVELTRAIVTTAVDLRLEQLRRG